MSHKKSDLGQSLYKSRFGKANKYKNKDKMRPSMKSVLEESDIQKIFSIGALTGKDYTAIRVINDKDKEGILDQFEKKKFEEAKKEYEKFLSVPRRPKGAKNMTKEKLLETEKLNFLEWRRRLSEIEQDKRLQLTPFELNLDFWRQLWRVIERSDVLIQVVDGRNPLLFRNTDLESYVKEVDQNKINILLINKADLLTEKQREQWAAYFDNLNLRVIFWSAKVAEDKRKAEKLAESEAAAKEELDGDKESEDENVKECDDEEDSVEDQLSDDDASLESEEADSKDEECDEDTESFRDSEESKDEFSSDMGNEEEVIKNSSEMIGVEEILEIFESMKIKNPIEPGKTTVGLVGYPNVGKSSTINAIFGQKKVSVSATPGHTKRFQTLNITEKLTFCDCPGLVMPSVVHSKGHLMVSGILPIDTIRDYIAPINLIAQQFPRETIEMMYGIQLPPVMDEENPNRPPTARELLSSYSYMHGMMTSKGNPNLDRAARIILKDYVDGKLLYRHPPPDIEPEQFESAAGLSEEKRMKTRPKPSGAKVWQMEEPTMPMNASNIIIGGANYSKVKPSAMKDAINRISKAEAADNNADTESLCGDQTEAAKPWRANLKEKRCQREKMRRLHSSLDQHAYVYK